MYIDSYNPLRRNYPLRHLSKCKGLFILAIYRPIIKYYILFTKRYLLGYSRVTLGYRYLALALLEFTTFRVVVFET